MLSLAHKLLIPIAVTSGIAAYVMPLMSPWYLLTIIPPLLIIYNYVSGLRRVLIVGVVVLLVLFLLLGYLSPTLVSASLSAAALVVVGNPIVAFVVLLPHFSSAATLQSILSIWLSDFGMAMMAPSVMVFMSLIILASRLLHSVLLLIGLVLSAAISLVVVEVNLSPSSALAIAGIPVILVSSIFGNLHVEEPNFRINAQVFAVYLLCLSVWIITPPKNDGEVWVLLPESTDSYESKYFTNYVDALRFSGIDAKSAFFPDEIPRESTVILPWLTEVLPGEKQFGNLAREREWTVVVGGEHTNMGDISSRLSEIIGHDLLLDDLSVPPNNSDYSGHLWMPVLSSWPHDAVFNRGASVSPRGLTDKIILQGDGWWIEPNIREWLWLGDYQWQSGEQAGRVPLAVVSDIRGARWVVLGDNSILVNRQLIADPRAAQLIMRSANLWPVFLYDLSLFGIALGLFFVGPMSISLLLIVVPLFMFSSLWPVGGWKDIYTGLSGFNESNFNNVISDSPQLIKERRLIKSDIPLDGVSEFPDGKVIVFNLVNDGSEISGVKFDDCRRLGALQTSEGPYLMDAQACRVHGDVSILIGSYEAAVAVAIEGGDKIIILDRAFLSNKSPAGNAVWLLNQL